MIGIPLGVTIFNTVGAGLAAVQLSAPVYAAVAGSTIVFYALVVSLPARVLSSRQIAPVLGYE